MSKINFVRSNSKNYVGVQDQLIGLITRHLKNDVWSQSVRKKKPGALNLTFFNKQPGDILMSHGVADKNYFFRQREDGRYYLDGFEYGFVPGNWLRNRIINHPEVRMQADNIHVVGWPRLDMLSELAAKKPSSDRLRILWAPTHDYKNTDACTVSSYPKFEDYLPKLRQHFDVDVSLHPRNRTDKTPTGEKLAQCDVLISDFGTTVYEALALGIPVVFPDWIIKDGVIAEYGEASPGQLFLRNIGLHPDSFDEMMDMLASGPELDQATRDYAANIIEPTTVGRSGQLTAEALLSLSHGYEGGPTTVMDRLRALIKL